MVWTRFRDMHSGGSQKEKFSTVLIEAEHDDAISVFYSRFGHNPERVTCTCCGSDYSITDGEELDQITGYYRNAYLAGPKTPENSAEFRYFDRKEDVPDDWKCQRDYGNRPVISLEEYLAQDDVVIIYANEIGFQERRAVVPEQGYIWQD